MQSITTNNTITTPITPPIIEGRNLWCRYTYAQFIANVFEKNPFNSRIGRCNNDHCIGAHHPDEIIEYSHLTSYTNMNKSKINWVQLYINTIETLNRDIYLLHSEEEKRKIKEVSKLNIFETMQLWKDLSIKYRKIVKQLPRKANSAASIATHASGFKFAEDVPKFLITEYDDQAWGFERLTRICSIHKSIDEKIKSGEKASIKDLCLATGTNCKEGVHWQEEMLCFDDFLTGTCSCESKFNNDKRKYDVEKEIISIQKNIEKIPNTKKNFRTINKLNDDIYELKRVIKSINKSRKKHYTDDGMIPFNICYDEYKKEKEKEKDELAKIEKMTWEKEFGAISEVKEVKKLIKPIKKK